VTEIRYAELHASPPLQTVQTVGTAAGPSGGDNWTQLASLPQNKMAGTSEYAVLVTGKIGRVQLAGTGASKGMLQVCLGTTAGTRLPNFRVNIPVDQAPLLSAPLSGLSFQFLLFVSTPFPDSVLGSSFNPAGSQLCLWARTYTNGDAQTYAVTFIVADVNWLWFDLTRIPSAHWAASDAVGTNPFPTSAPTSWQSMGSAFGAAGEQWLHFANVWYETLSYGALSPRFTFGISPDGNASSVTKKVGNSGRWGRNRTPFVAGSTETAMTQIGCLWTHTNAGATTKYGYHVWEPAPATSVGKRWRHLAIRIDPLTDVHVRQQAGPDALAQTISVPTWPDNYLTIERPAAGTLTEPIVIAHGVVAHNPPPLFAPQAGFAARVFEESAPNPQLGDVGCFPQSDASRGEAASSIAFGRRMLQVLSPAMQWRVSFPGDDVFASASLQNVYDFGFVTFHPVRDPNNVTTGPGSALAPLLLVPGKQSPDPGSLSPPPIAPNGEVLERGNLERNKIQGATGYSRGWPLGARQLRVLTVTWGPLNEDDAAEVFDFLRNSPTWRYTPPKSAALAVLTMTRPVLMPVSHRTFTITVDVAVLVWTGA
jgi:hypothetical protein